MASGNKKEYQAVLNVLLDHSTLAARINKLNKIYLATEDASLRKLLGQLIVLLKQAANVQTRKSEVMSVDINSPHFKPLVDYCRRCLASITPQWQIIAAQHGWGPKK